MKMNRKIVICGACLIGLAVVLMVLFRSSWTEDGYVCHSCKNVGESTAFRVFRCPIMRSPIRLAHSLTGNECDQLKQQWEWYFANSHGICFNTREDRDGPIGAYPYQEELDRQVAENRGGGVTADLIVSHKGRN